MNADTKTAGTAQTLSTPGISRALLQEYSIVLIFLGVCVLFALWTGGLFLRPDNIMNVLRQISINAIIATGMTFVIITTGNIDLSVGSVVALVAVTSAKILKALVLRMPIWPAIAASCVLALVVGGAVGAWNGFFVTRFKVPPFISTLSMWAAARGVAFILCDGRPIWNLPIQFDTIGRGYVLEGLFGPWIPIPVIIMAVFMIVAHVILARTRTGRYAYATGGNMEAARLSGINVRKARMIAYIASGVSAALASLVLTSRLASGQPNSGEMYELYAIAACVVGGTSLSGGKGTILGTFVGALLIGTLNNGLNLAGVESYTQNVILGLVILGAVILDQFRKRD